MKSCWLITICICAYTTAGAQKLTRHDAQKLFDKTITCLKNSDTIAFVNQWVFDNKRCPYHNVPFEQHQAKAHFGVLKKFMDSAFANNLDVAEIEVEAENPGDTANYFSPYSIKAWYIYRTDYKKGFGFNVDYVNGQWMYRWAPDYSVMETPYNQTVRYKSRVRGGNPNAQKR